MTDIPKYSDRIATIMLQLSRQIETKTAQLEPQLRNWEQYIGKEIYIKRSIPYYSHEVRSNRVIQAMPQERQKTITYIKITGAVVMVTEMIKYDKNDCLPDGERAGKLTLLPNPDSAIVLIECRGPKESDAPYYIEPQELEDIIDRINSTES